MTRWRILAVLVLVVLAIFAGSAFPAGDFTADGTTSANMDRVRIANDAPFHQTTTHSIVTWHRTSTSGVGQVVFGRMTAAATGSNFRQSIAIANNMNSRATSGGVDGAAYTVAPAGNMTTGATRAMITLFSSATDAVGRNSAASATDASVSASDDPTAVPYIGAERSGADGTFGLATDFRGHIDRVRFYSRRLSVPEATAQLERNFRSSRVSPAGLEGDWIMRGAPGTNIGTVPDISNSNRSPGTAGGTTLPTYSESYLRGVR